MTKLLPFLYWSHFDDSDSSCDECESDWFASILIISPKETMAKSAGDDFTKQYVTEGYAKNFLGSEVIPIMGDILIPQGIRNFDWANLSDNCLFSLFLAIGTVKPANKELAAFISCPDLLMAKQIWEKLLYKQSKNFTSNVSKSDIGVIRFGDEFPSNWELIKW